MSTQKSNTPTILLAEDEEALGMIVQESLQSRGFEVWHCKDGQEAWQCFESRNPNLLVLDVMMPKMDGFELVKKIRKRNQWIPIIFLTAKSRTEDVVEGFGYGANDYLKKPFSMEELIVRINALLQRNQVTKTGRHIGIGSYYFHPERQLLMREGTEQTLTHRESALLHALCQYQNQLTPRKEILESLWGCDDFFNARSMDVFITKLRKKLADDAEVKIVNVRGYGYKLVC